MVQKEPIWQALKTVAFPGYDQTILGVVQRVEIEGESTVVVGLGVAHLGAEPKAQIEHSVQAALGALPGVQSVRVEFEQRALPPSPNAAARRGIRRVVAIGSGKGGVGKSTVSVNVAVALARQGLRVGIMDADIFGPNVPRMLGVDHLPENSEGGGIPPAEAYGLKMVSVGLLVGANQAVVWRGPMTDKIMRQFLEDVAWGDLDVLLVDLPPGTGDIAISLAKHAQPDGAVVVVTPQEVALDDARKAVSMFRRLNVPVLGLVENMSWFLCDQCDTQHFLFGQGGGERLAAELGLPLLGQIPFEPEVRSGGDEGAPAASRDDSQAGAALRGVAARIVEALVERETAEQ